MIACNSSKGPQASLATEFTLVPGQNTPDGFPVTLVGELTNGATLEAWPSPTLRYFYFWFRAERAQRVIGEAFGRSHPDVDTVLALYATSGDPAAPTGAPLAMNDDFGGRPSSRVEFTTRSAGIYALAVRRYDREGRGGMGVKLTLEAPSNVCMAEGDECSDGNACTENDRCQGSTCVGTHMDNCRVPVRVEVRDQAGQPVMLARIRMLNGEQEIERAESDWQGLATLQQPEGSERYKVIVRGVPTYSSYCVAPQCTSVSVTTGAANRYRVVNFEDLNSGAFDMTMGSLRPNNPIFVQNGVRAEYWAVQDYLRPGAAFTDAHGHIGVDGFDMPGVYGNASQSELQHAFERIQQGLYLRLSNGRPFRVVSVDTRIRSDSDRQHISEIPGNDAAHVALLVASQLTLETSSFRRYELGAPTATTRFETTYIHEFESVTEAFVSSTYNVTLDDIVLEELP